MRSIVYDLDFTSYLEQAAAWHGHGITDYSRLTSKNGPIQYPALSLYLFTFISWLCSDGKNIVNAQLFFGALYLVNALVLYQVMSLCQVTKQARDDRQVTFCRRP